MVETTGGKLVDARTNFLIGHDDADPSLGLSMNDLTSRLGPKENLYKYALEGRLSASGLKGDIPKHDRHLNWLPDALVVEHFTAPLMRVCFPTRQPILKGPNSVVERASALKAILVGPDKPWYTKMTSATKTAFAEADCDLTCLNPNSASEFRTQSESEFRI